MERKNVFMKHYIPRNEDNRYKKFYFSQLIYVVGMKHLPMDNLDAW